MPYSTFFNAYIRTSMSVVSLRPTSPSPFSIASTRFRRLFHRNLPMGFVNLQCRPGSVPGVRCMTQSKWVEVSFREKQQDQLRGFRQKNIGFPFLQHQPCSNYGRFAYDDVSSDDSDVEFGSPPGQMVCLFVLFFFPFSNCMF